jgi:hypothetical protein
MHYSDLILQESEYTYSSNVQLDIENDNKLARFIPNETTIGLLREYLVDIVKLRSEIHSRILYGSYGTGKSHFLTVLSLLLGKMHIDGVAYNTFIRRINVYDENLGTDIDRFVNTSKPYLIVPIVFDFPDFERCVYFSLKKVLTNKGIDINLKSFYTYALEVFQQWMSQEESAERLHDTCRKNKTSEEILIAGLEKFDSKYQNVFEKVFADMTFGLQFVYEVTNLVENLDQVNKAIVQDYSGIVFIFDEFGRYLEDNIKKIRIKSIQDMAEYCDHSGTDTHLILVSHKEIGQYTRDYSKNVINEWKKVEGRFRSTSINDKHDQCLSLVKNIFVKNSELWTTFQRSHRAELNALYTSALDFKGFLVDQNNATNPFEGGFPLHPITLYALDKLSKKVAQNERTFFTYLAGTDENSLKSFLQRTNLDEFHFVGIDEIYNYFEQNIKSIQSDASYEYYRQLQTALNKCQLAVTDISVVVKILKALTVIAIVNDGSTLVANKKTMMSAIDVDNTKIEDALAYLIHKKVVKYSGPYDRYEFFDGSFFDIEKMIVSEMDNIHQDVICKTLNENFVDFVLYPDEYNIVYKIKRVFLPIFTTFEEMEKKSFIKQAPSYYDGILALVVGNKEISIESVQSSTRGLERVLVAVECESEKIIYEVKRYISILYLESQKDRLAQKDPAVIKEIAYYREEAEDKIRNLIFQWRSLQRETILVAAEGQIYLECNSLEQLSIQAGELMFKHYPGTMIVNNELINKNVLSGSIGSAQRTAIRSILKNEDIQTYFGLPVLSPEYICVRSVLAKNRIYEAGDIVQANTLPNGTSSAELVMNAFQKYIQSCANAPTSVFDLFDKLRCTPLGLRKGYLPLLFAYYFQQNRKGMVISSYDVDQEFTAELFEEMVKRPDDYKVFITTWSEEQSNFIISLEQLYDNYIDVNAQNKNRLKALYEGMFLHYKDISKFARTTELFAFDVIKLYRKLMLVTHTNYSKFFFEKLRGFTGNYTSSLEAIKNVKQGLELLPQKLTQTLIEDVQVIFPTSKRNPSLAEMLQLYYQNEWKVKKDKSFDYYTNSWLEMISKLPDEAKDNEVIDRMAKLLTGFEIIYWNDSHKEEFIKRILDIKNTLDSYTANDKLSVGESSIIIKDSNGTEKMRIFESKELSTTSKTMKNKIKATFDNFGQSVAYDEKVQVLVSLLGDLLEN